MPDLGRQVKALGPAFAGAQREGVHETGLYTPLKRRTSMNTLIGAVPGTVPPLIGWAAARGNVDPAALSLFLILFL